MKRDVFWSFDTFLEQSLFCTFHLWYTLASATAQLERVLYHWNKLMSTIPPHTFAKLKVAQGSATDFGSWTVLTVYVCVSTRESGCGFWVSEWTRGKRGFLQTVKVWPNKQGFSMRISWLLCHKILEVSSTENTCESHMRAWAHYLHFRLLCDLVSISFRKIDLRCTCVCSWLRVVLSLLSAIWCWSPSVLRARDSLF